ncbi:ABC-F type ribosomal protection protein [Gottfriedia acidiceleris]|uniref:ribosomal protection-like ABC-F family protein n=2 Tax=Bacillales TaxID=1385 RepID=UPI000BEB515A|nr:MULTISPECIES: ABC-F type ribosomal protection protein [unclassified Bacillus (in: firmicutes)]PEC47650.1 ABC transporter ATP-binding protein [Bacillus sp. AFS096315]PFM83097.1 ABC transporter ATP-binding protein [Bacillus sp. AFS077874]
MFIIKASNIEIELNGKTIFKNGNLDIKQSERVALIGENGVGKSTFINALLGNIPLKKGILQIHYSKDEIGWLLTDEENQENLSAREVIESFDQERYFIKKNIEKYLLDLSNEENLANYNESLSKYLELDGYDWETKVDQVLKKFQLPQELWNIPFSHLSGGQKTKVKLAKVMMKQPKLLILDEPTNHLDTESIQWLTEWLQNFKGSVLFISHERKFIDDVATVTVELTESGTLKYNGGYSTYKIQKEHERKTQQAQYEKQEAEKKKLIETINQYKQWFTSSHNAASERDPFAKKQAAKNALRFKSKEKDLDRLEKRKVEKPKEVKTISASFENDSFSAKQMITFEKVNFSYDEKSLFNQVDFILNREDRLAVIGKNGSGKSTFLKLLTGLMIPNNGAVRHNPQLKIGYFMQELEALNEDSTILNEILSLPNMTETEARTILACFLFRREDVYKNIAQLSMGEKCRVAFVKLYFSDSNLLVLDEPTNYLDIHTRERIEEALAAYPGAVVVVSHDPYLLKKVSNRVIHIENGNLYEFKGSFADWNGRQNISNDQQALLNERIKLQLEIAAMNAEEKDTDEEKKAQISKIVKLQKELDGINERLLTERREKKG